MKDDSQPIIQPAGINLRVLLQSQEVVVPSPPSPSWWVHPSVVFPAGNDSNTNGCVILWVCACVCVCLWQTYKITNSAKMKVCCWSVCENVCLFGREVVQKIIHWPEWIIGWTRIEFPVCWLIFFETFTFYRPWHEQGHRIVRVTRKIIKLLVRVVNWWQTIVFVKLSSSFF